MKNTLLKIYLLGFFLLADFIAFAQPGSDSPDGDLEGTDPPATPINGKLIWLGIAAVLFAHFMYNQKRKRA